MKRDLKKLFVSFRASLVYFKEGKITPADLQAGLFYFGCERVHLLEDLGENIDVVEVFDLAKKPGNKAFAVRTYSNIQAAVFNAEAEKRALFKQYGGRNSFSELNRVLRANKIETSSVKDLETDPEYGLPKVEERYSGLVKVIS